MMRPTLAAAACSALAVGLLTAGTGSSHASGAETSRVGAQVVVGQTGTSAPCGPAGSTWVQYATAAAPTYAVPGAGVITSFSHNANAAAGSIRAVVVGPGAVPNDRAVLAVSPLVAVTPSTLNTFPARIPVPAGASLGLYLSANSMGCLVNTPAAGDVLAGSVSDPSVSGTFTPVGPPATSRRLNLSAVWEPDVDKDLYGDVSQDLCPQSAQTQAACPAPDTTITKAPAKRSSKRQAKIKFASVPGATFTCSVDGKPAKPCTSPFKKRYRYDKHKVVVTAVSSVGIADPTPAVVKFRIRPPR